MAEALLDLSSASLMTRDFVRGCVANCNFFRHREHRGAIFMVDRSKPKSDPARSGGDRRQPSRWYAVSIVPGETSCKLVRMHQGTRWLSAEAPRLPVPGCDEQQCECRYRHFADRRANVQRKQDRDGWVRNFKGDDRRSGVRGRRASDLE